MTLQEKELELLEAARVSRLITNGGPTDCLFAVGQWPAKIDSGWAERVGVIDVSGSRPHLLLDGWLAQETIAELRTLEALAARGNDGWDVMFATRWKYAWGGTPFRVFSRRGPRVIVRGPGTAEVRTFLARRTVKVLGIRGEISNSWMRHRVGLTLADGGVSWVAATTDISPMVDPTYDGLNLLADAGWVGSLGKRLAEALGVTYASNDIAAD